MLIILSNVMIFRKGQTHSSSSLSSVKKRKGRLTCLQIIAVTYFRLKICILCMFYFLDQTSGLFSLTVSFILPINGPTVESSLSFLAFSVADLIILTDKIVIYTSDAILSHEITSVTEFFLCVSYQCIQS